MISVLKFIASFGIIPIIVSLITSILMTKKHKIYDLDNKIYFYDYQKLDKMCGCIAHKINEVNTINSSTVVYKKFFYSYGDSKEEWKVQFSQWAKDIFTESTALRDKKLPMLGFYIKSIHVIHDSFKDIIKDKKLLTQYNSLFNETNKKLDSAKNNGINLYMNNESTREKVSKIGKITNQILYNLSDAYRCMVKIQMLELKYDNSSTFNKHLHHHLTFN